MVAVKEDVNLILRKAIHFHDPEAKQELLELIASNKESEEKVDVSLFQISDGKERQYYDTLAEATLVAEEDIVHAMMVRNEPLFVYFGYFLKQENWGAVNLFTRIYLQKFPFQNFDVFATLMEKALNRKEQMIAITFFKTIASVDALTAEALRPMVEQKIPLEQQMLLSKKVEIKSGADDQD